MSPNNQQQKGPAGKSVGASEKNLETEEIHNFRIETDGPKSRVRQRRQRL